MIQFFAHRIKRIDPLTHDELRIAPDDLADQVQADLHCQIAAAGLEPIPGEPTFLWVDWIDAVPHNGARIAGYISVKGTLHAAYT